MADHQQSYFPEHEEQEAIRVARARGAIATLGYQHRVSVVLVQLLLYLQRYDRDKSGCRARLETIGNYLGKQAGTSIPRRSVTRYLTYLREAGLVEYERRNGLPVNRVVESRVKELATGANPTREHDQRPAQESGATSRQSGATSRQSGATSRQSGAPNKQSIKPFSKPSTSQGAPLCEGWEEEEEKLLNLGMGAAEDAIAKASKRGVSLDEVQGLVAYWESMQPAWAIGALYVQLGRLRPGMKPEGLPWPPKSDEWLRQQRQVASGRRQQSQVDERAALAAERTADVMRRAVLEAEHGEELDRLSDEEYREMVDRLSPGMAAMFPHSLREQEIVRMILLEKLAQPVIP